MTPTVLTISSKNYGAWALRGWLMAKLVELDFSEEVISPDDPAMRAEMLLLSSSIRVPALHHNGIEVWDTLAIAEYLAELNPSAGLLPADKALRARCRSRTSSRPRQARRSRRWRSTGCSCGPPSPRSSSARTTRSS